MESSENPVVEERIDDDKEELSVEVLSIETVLCLLRCEEPI